MVRILTAMLVSLLIGYGAVEKPSKPNLSEPMPFEIIKTFVVVAEGDISNAWIKNVEIFLDTLLSFQNEKKALKRQYIIYFFPGDKNAIEKLKNRIRETTPQDINLKLKREIIEKVEKEGAMRGIVWQKGRDGVQITFTMAPWPPSLFGQSAEILYLELIKMEKGK